MISEQLLPRSQPSSSSSSSCIRKKKKKKKGGKGGENTQHRVDKNGILEGQVFSGGDRQIKFKDGLFEARYAGIVNRILLVQIYIYRSKTVFLKRDKRG
jgi:hypothetical protein